MRIERKKGKKRIKQGLRYEKINEKKFDKEKKPRIL